MSTVMGGVRKVSAPVFNNNGRGQRDNSTSQEMQERFQKFLGRCRREGHGTQIVDMQVPESILPVTVFIADTTGSMSGGSVHMYHNPKSGETFHAYNNKGELV